MTVAVAQIADHHGRTYSPYQANQPYHRALLAKLPDPGQSAWQLAHLHPVPRLDSGQVLIKTTHVALNPFDWQGVAFKYGIGPEAKVMGRDGAGVVVGVGDGVRAFKTGDRVWFCADSSRSGTGAFQEYSVHSSCHVGHTPDCLSDEQAATLGTGLITAGVALFKTLNLPLSALTEPATQKVEKEWLLIWGGSGITGVYLVQLAQRMGYRVICAASPSNHDYVRSLGAEVVLDRWEDSANLLEQIRVATGDNIRIAIDNVGQETAGLCRKVLQGSTSWRKKNNISISSLTDVPGRMVPLAGQPKDTTFDNDSIRPVEILRISFSTTFYAQREFARPLLDVYADLLEAGELRPARVKYVQGGLDGIEKGLDDLRRGLVPGGYKLVARLADTARRPEGGEKHRKPL